MPADLIDGYVDALERNDFDAVLDVLGSDMVFQSPFHAWSGWHLRAVYAARTLAFVGVRIDAVVRDGDHAAILWQATVAAGPADSAPVQSCEVVSLAGPAIERVDVFLRPAEVLPVVHAAMARAWPD